MNAAAHDTAPPDVPEVTAYDKERSTLAAELALAGGFALLQLADGSYLVTRWNASRHLADLHGVKGFLRQVKGTAV